MSFLEPVPRPVKAEFSDPNGLEYFVDNLITAHGRFSKEDALLISHRHNLAAALKLFIGYMRTKGLDGEDRVIYQDLIKLQGDLKA
jgi:hypothetical protein